MVFTFAYKLHGLQKILAVSKNYRVKERPLAPSESCENMKSMKVSGSQLSELLQMHTASKPKFFQNFIFELSENL